MVADSIIKLYPEKDVLAAAELIMRLRLRNGDAFTSPEAVKAHVRYRLGNEHREHFMVLFLDAQNKLIESEVMFSGTVNQTSVYPREVVRRAMLLNAVSVVLAHNHPSDTVEPSSSDKVLTKSLGDALKLVDVRVLDHVITGRTATFSFAENGLI